MDGQTKKENIDPIILNYEPKEFPTVVTPAAQNFVKKQDEGSTDFKINELAAEMVGISELRKKTTQEKIEEQALQKLKEIEERAYAEAYELGKIEGAEKAMHEKREQLEERIAKFDQLLIELQNIRKLIFDKNETQIMQLTLYLASKIAYKEVSEQPDSILNAIREVIGDVQNDENIILKVSQEDFKFLEGLRENADRKDLSFLKTIKIEASQHTETGGCLLETNFGTIDASLEQRIAKAWDVLHEKTPKLRDQDENE